MVGGKRQISFESPATPFSQVLRYVPKQPHLVLCKAWAEKPMLVQFIRNAYLASHHEWLEWIRECPDDASSCWIVGHNPGLSDVVKQLSGQELWLPTCGMAGNRIGHRELGSYI